MQFVSDIQGTIKDLLGAVLGSASDKLASAATLVSQQHVTDSRPDVVLTVLGNQVGVGACVCLARPMSVLARVHATAARCTRACRQSPRTPCRPLPLLLTCPARS